MSLKEMLQDVARHHNIGMSEENGRTFFNGNDFRMREPELPRWVGGMTVDDEGVSVVGIVSLMPEDRGELERGTNQLIQAMDRLVKEYFEDGCDPMAEVEEGDYESDPYDLEDLLAGSPDY